MAIGTPFHARTAALCTSFNWRQWSGYFVASSYDDFVEPEYHAIRGGAALIDVSPLYKYVVSGPDAVGLVDRVVTRDATKCRVGQVLYTPWCDAKGRVLQDGTFQRLSETTFRVTAADPTLKWLERNAFGMDVRVDDVSEKVVALALQGPRSLEVLNRIAKSDLTALTYFSITTAELDGIRVHVSRTGYTGDRGYEIWAEGQDALPLWDALVRAGQGLGVHPCGMLALDLARIEAGYPLIEVDYTSAEKALIPSQESTPYEIGLGWAVNLKKKGAFVGRDALHRESARGSAKRFVGIEVTWDELEKLFKAADLPPQIPVLASRVGVPVYAGPEQIGKVTSSCWSRLLKKFIGLATLDTPYVKEGTAVDLEMTVEYMRRRVRARVTKLPFFDPERKKA